MTSMQSNTLTETDLKEINNYETKKPEHLSLNIANQHET